MAQALSGFAIIWLVIATGWMLAHRNVLNMAARAVFNKTAFNVATPALLFTLVSKGSLEHVFSRTFVVSALAVLGTITIYLLANALVFHNGLGAATIGSMCSAYTNAGFLGLPIAQHLLGDMTWMAPILLMQVAVLQPTALACLDAAQARGEGRRVPIRRYLVLPFRNPFTAGILAGLLVNVTHVTVPDFLDKSVSMIGNMAVPMMLIAFGISLRLDALPGTGPHAREVWFAQVMKNIAMPALAFGVGTVMGLTGPQLLAVTVIAALPTAQVVFVIATRYDRATLMARDSVFWSTILSVPVIVFLASIFGGF